MLQPCSTQSPNSHVGKSCSSVGLRHKHFRSTAESCSTCSGWLILGVVLQVLLSVNLSLAAWLSQSPVLCSFIASYSCSKSSLGTWGLSAPLWRSGNETHRRGLGGEDRQTDREWENSMKGALMAGTQGKGVGNPSRRKWPGKYFSNLGWVPLPSSSPHEQLPVHSVDFPP